MISSIYIHEPENSPCGVVIGITGRNTTLGSMFDLIANAGLNRSVLVVIQPKNLEWYPAPNGPGDQKNAINGLNNNVKHLVNRIKSIQSMYGFDKNLVSLIGYSAGAVMALKVIECSEYNFAGVVALSGVVLDPVSLRPASNNTPLLLKHSFDDECFEWEERYVPSRDALIARGYNVTVEEKQDGGHGVTLADIHAAGRFLRPKLGYR